MISVDSFCGWIVAGFHLGYPIGFLLKFDIMNMGGFLYFDWFIESKQFWVNIIEVIVAVFGIFNVILKVFLFFFCWDKRNGVYRI